MKYIPFLFVSLLFSCKNTSNKEVHPTRQDITELVFATGVLQPDPVYNLVVQSDGYLTHVDFKENDVVNSGQTIAYIDNKNNSVNLKTAQEQLTITTQNTTSNAPALKQLRASIQTMEQKVQQDELQVQRLKRLLAQETVSKLELELAELTLKTSKGNLEGLKAQYAALEQQAQQQQINQQGVVALQRISTSYNQVKVPVGGKIYKKLKEAGDYVKKGEIIAQIGSPTTLIAELYVDENSIGKVKIGQEVTLQLNTNKTKNYKGIVYEILPSFNEQKQAFITKVKFTDSLDFKISGTQLEANITIQTKAKALLIPRALMGYGNTVTLSNDSIKTIETGIISSEWVEVRSGLTEQDVIVPFKPQKK